MMIVIGLVSGFSMNEISDKFIKGCKPMIYASFITGLASAIAVILNQGKVLDTIVYALSIPLNQVGAVVGAGLMVVVNVIVNIFIPSGSGQACQHTGRGLRGQRGSQQGPAQSQQGQKPPRGLEFPFHWVELPSLFHPMGSKECRTHGKISRP